LNTIRLFFACVLECECLLIAISTRLLVPRYPREAKRKKERRKWANKFANRQPSINASAPPPPTAAAAAFHCAMKGMVLTCWLVGWLIVLHFTDLFRLVMSSRSRVLLCSSSILPRFPRVCCVLGGWSGCFVYLSGAKWAVCAPEQGSGLLLEFYVRRACKISTVFPVSGSVRVCVYI
jgi:hypothetical protein